MPRVFELAGFRIYVYLPPAEHGPAHVHVIKAGAEVVIRIGTGEALVPYRIFGRITNAEVIRAVRIVESRQDELLCAWRLYHGE